MCEKRNCVTDDINHIINCNWVNWGNLQSKTVLVTGATGLVGRLIVKSLLYRNQKHNSDITIVCVVRNQEKVKSIFKDALEDTRLHFLYQDVCQPIEWSGDIHFILHGASVTASAEFIENPVQTLDTAISGTKNILELARKKSSSIQGIVYLSSMEVYGVCQESAELISEDDLGYIDLMNVRSCYPESKRLCENMCVAYASQYLLPIKIARLAQTFGAGVDHTENRIFAQFAKNAIAGRDIVLHTQGDTVGNYVYTADAIIALLGLLHKGESGQAYNVANEVSTTTVRQMAHLVAEEIAVPPVRVIVDAPKAGKSYGYAPTSKMRLSASKLMGLGWIPTVDLRQAYIRMIHDFD